MRTHKQVVLVIWNLLMAAGIFTPLPIVVLFLVAEWYFVQGLSAVAGFTSKYIQTYARYCKVSA